MASVKDLKGGQVSIELGGELRTIKYDMNSFAELEKRYGSVEAALDALDAGKLGPIRDMLWAGLIHDQAIFDEITGEVIKFKINPHQVGSWLDLNSMKSVMPIITSAITGALPEQEKKAIEAKIQEMKVADAAGGVKVATVVPTAAEAEAQKEEQKNV